MQQQQRLISSAGLGAGRDAKQGSHGPAPLAQKALQQQGAAMQSGLIPAIYGARSATSLSDAPSATSTGQAAHSGSRQGASSHSREQWRQDLRQRAAAAASRHAAQQAAAGQPAQLSSARSKSRSQLPMQHQKARVAASGEVSSELTGQLMLRGGWQHDAGHANLAAASARQKEAGDHRSMSGACSPITGEAGGVNSLLSIVASIVLVITTRWAVA